MIDTPFKTALALCSIFVGVWVIAVAVILLGIGSLIEAAAQQTCMDTATSVSDRHTIRCDWPEATLTLETIGDQVIARCTCPKIPEIPR